MAGQLVKVLRRVILKILICSLSKGLYIVKALNENDEVQDEIHKE
jgi:hypothetical protein